MTTYTFDDLRAAVQDCTSYDLVQRMGDDYEEFVLVDPYGDQDGDPFSSMVGSLLTGGSVKVDVIISSIAKRSLPVVALLRRPVATLRSMVIDIIVVVIVIS